MDEWIEIYVNELRMNENGWMDRNLCKWIKDEWEWMNG